MGNKITKADGVSTVDEFLAEMKAQTSLSGGSRQGRLIFALDATMSRQPAWDRACKLQVGMFKEAAAIGGLEVQLIYYRGMNECQASRWISHHDQLRAIMERIHVRSGETQIRRILEHTRRETFRNKVHALVFVGDAMEEIAETLYGPARELGRLGTPAFMFQEDDDDDVEIVFRKIAQLTGGAYSRFDSGAAAQLAELLRAVAVFATGGALALADMRGNKSAARLLSQMKSR